MKKAADWLLGYYRVTVSGGSPQWFLNRLTQWHIPFWDIQWADEFQVTISVYRRDLADLTRIAHSAMCETEQVRQHGAAWCFRGLKKRMCVLTMLTLSVLAVLILPQFVWFYQVEGNSAIPSDRIIRAVQECGVGVGTYGKSIQPHLVKEQVLAKLPELAWLTVNQSGGRAAIVVREKIMPEQIPDRRAVQNIVASQPGIITAVSVLEGSAVVQPGDIVEKGQLLISGYMDLEYKYRACGALGEVYARTWRSIKSVTPGKSMKKTQTGKEKTVTYLCFGRKRIKITPGSGIFPTGCDKMSQETFLTLPGGLQLPLSVVKEHYVFYDTEEAAVLKQEAEDILRDASVTDAEQQMIAGVIEDAQWDLQKQKGNYIMNATLQCREMISRAVKAEIFKGEMQHDGTSN